MPGMSFTGMAGIATMNDTTLQPWISPWLDVSRSRNLSVSITRVYPVGTETNSSQQLTGEDKRRYLEHLQEQTTQDMIAALVYMVILILVGLVGNSLVLFVYSTKFKQTATRVFIIAIAVYDLAANVVAMPGGVYEMLHKWDLDMPILCKVMRFANSVTVMGSAMVLVAVAVVRFRKICKPFQKQVSVQMAVVINIGIIIGAVIFSLPYAVFNGRSTKETPLKGTFTIECSLEDRYKRTIWPIINGAFSVLFFLCCSIPMVVLYILIGQTAWKHSRVHGVGAHFKNKSDSPASGSSNCNSNSTNSTDDQPSKRSNSSVSGVRVNQKENHSSHLSPNKNEIANQLEMTEHDQNEIEKCYYGKAQPMQSEKQDTNENNGKIHSVNVIDGKGVHNEDKANGKSNMKEPEGTRNGSVGGKAVTKSEIKKRGSSRRSNSKKESGADVKETPRRGIRRTTVMLVLITTVYILSFLPFLILIFVKFFIRDFVGNMNSASLIFYNLFLRSYYLNSAANPIIYSLCDANFRRECFALLRCKTRSCMLSMYRIK